MSSGSEAAANVETRLIAAGRRPAVTQGAVNPPVFRASTFLFDTVAAFEAAAKDPYAGPFYGRLGTPTTFAFEEAMAEAEGGYRSIATSSGLSAIAAVLVGFLGQGDHLLMVDTVYEPARRFCTRVLERSGVSVTYYDPLAGAGIEGLIRPETRLIYMESPGSGTFEVQDVRAIAAAAKARGVATAIDATWATPLFLQPLALGVDVSIHAATKYVVGHSDAMLGVVTTTREAFDPVRRASQDMGACAGAEECNLGLRGLRTLPVRLRQHQENGLALARWLQARPEVARVFHPGLPGDPGNALWRRDFTGASGLFGIELRPVPKTAVDAFIDALRLFRIGFSWGGFESLVLPTHPERARTATAWSGEGPTVRFHAGLENVDDLIADLERGFATARMPAARMPGAAA